MEIVQQHIVRVNDKLQILYMTYSGYFISSNGGFGQRDTYIEKISDQEAKRFMDLTYAFYNNMVD